MTDIRVLNVLEKFHLEKYYDAFAENDVSVEDMRRMTMSDYGQFGVKENDDIAQLFRAVQHIKVAYPDTGTPRRLTGELKLLCTDVDKENVASEDALLLPNKGQQTMCKVQAGPPATAPKPQKSRICVAIRKRPLNSAEEGMGQTDVIATDNEAELILSEPKQRVDLSRYIMTHRFAFDEVFAEQATNEEVYARTAAGLMDTVFEGGFATCFAYGQTGSGKTHTMMGSRGKEGMYVMAAKDMLWRTDSTKYKVSVSFYEIYSGKLFDLLNNRSKLKPLEDAKQMVQIVGLTSHDVEDVRQLMNLVDNGNRLRSSGSTGANDTSSRSHAILVMNVKSKTTDKVFGKFTFIDLAGSERGADTLDCDRQTRLEGAEINKSLLALKECIRALDQSHRHVPFRGSKLTEVLRDSFIGNCRTVMIGAISPGSLSCEHTLNTLRYADRVKELKKAPGERQSADEMMRGPNPNEICEVSEGARKSLVRPSALPRKSTKPEPKPDRRHKTPTPGSGAHTPLVATSSNASFASANSERAPQATTPSSRAAPKARQSTAIPARRASTGRPSQQQRPSTSRSAEIMSGAFTRCASGSNYSSESEICQMSADSCDSNELQQAHEDVIQQIITEEEPLIAFHRQCVDELLSSMRGEFQDINLVDSPQSDIAVYVRTVLPKLEKNIALLTELRGKFSRLDHLISREETLQNQLTKLADDDE